MNEWIRSVGGRIMKEETRITPRNVHKDYSDHHNSSRSA